MILEQIFKITGLVTWVVIFIYVLFKGFISKHFLTKLGLSFALGNRLKQAIRNLLDQFPDKVNNDSISELAVALINRITRIFTIPMLISLLFAAIPFVLLFQQNKLIEKQNLLFEYQNKKITSQTVFDSIQTKLILLQTTLLESQNMKVDNQLELMSDQNRLVDYQNQKIKEQVYLLGSQNHNINLQNNLLEAERRSSLIFLLSNILDKVDEEIRFQRIDEVIDKFRLSDPLISRIIALSRAFKPYRILEFDSLSSQLVSPERGQLFIALMNSKLDSFTQAKISGSGDFSNAVIGEIKLENAILNNISLPYANLRGASFINSSLIEVDFHASDFSEPERQAPYSYIINEPRGGGFKGSILVLANFEEAILPVADFREAELTGVMFYGTDLREAFFDNGNLDYVRFDNANLENASFKNASLRAVVFEGASVKGADFSGVEFSDPRIIINGKEVNKGLKYEQFMTVHSLYGCKSLNPDIEQRLRKEQPCLFLKTGCLNKN